MKKYNLKCLSLILAVVFCLTSANAATIANNDKTVTVSENNLSSTYFTKGVYVNYAIEEKNPSKDYFYVFYDEKSGYTEDGRVGFGLPFVCEQMDGIIKFFFGGPDPESMDILRIESVNNGTITAFFKNNKKLLFVPLPDANSDKFDSQKYLKKHHKKNFRNFKNSKQNFGNK